MKFKAFFLCIIFLTSCKSFNSDIEFFEAKKYTDWFFTHKIKLFNKHYFNTNQVIRRPVLSWQLLAKLDVLGAGGNIDFSDCVFFKVPYSDSKKEGINKNGKINIASHTGSIPTIKTIFINIISKFLIQQFFFFFLTPQIQ